MIEFIEQLIVVLQNTVVFLRDSSVDTLIPLGESMAVLSS